MDRLDPSSPGEGQRGRPLCGHGAMNGEAQTVLEVTALTKRYGDQPALRDVSFAVRDGEVLGLIGPNGAGKTTLLESIAGLLPVDSGGIFWRAQPLPAQRRREAIFYLPD